MTTPQPKRIGGAVLMAVLVVAALVAATAPGAMARHGEDHPVVPGGQQSNNCSAEFTLPFDSQESENVSLTDPEDTWVTDVPDRPGKVQLDVDITEGGALTVEMFEKVDGDCRTVDGERDVGGPPEFNNLEDNQKYWTHVNLNDTQSDYTIILEDE